MMEMEPPVKRTPFERCGFHPRCCGCIPPQCSALIICAISFLWSMVELVATDKFISRIFVDRGPELKYAKIAYYVLTVGFSLACGILMVGLLVKRYGFLTAFIWWAFVYYCIYTVLYIVGVVVQITKDRLDKKLMVKIFCTVVWNCLFLYLMCVLNSYRIILWNIRAYIVNVEFSK